MNARMKNPAVVLPDAMKGIQNIYRAMYQGGVSPRLLELVHLRASQINACSACLYAGVEGAKKHGETDERLHAVAAWREAPFFTEEERAALLRELREELGLTEERDSLIYLGTLAAPAANEPGFTVEAELYRLVSDRPPKPAAEIAEIAWLSSDATTTVTLAPLTRDHVLPLWRSRE